MIRKGQGKSRMSADRHKIRREMLKLVAEDPTKIDPITGELMTAAIHQSQSKRHAFLAAYALLGTITSAAKTVGLCLGVKTIKVWLETDPMFKLQFEQAREEFVDRLEQEAYSRAVDGTKMPVLHQGKVVEVWVDKDGNIVTQANSKAVELVPLMEHKKSDALLMFVLKALKPEVYRDNSTVDINAKIMPVKQYMELDTDKV